MASHHHYYSLTDGWQCHPSAKAPDCCRTTGSSGQRVLRKHQQGLSRPALRWMVRSTRGQDSDTSLDTSQVWKNAGRRCWSVDIATIAAVGMTLVEHGWAWRPWWTEAKFTKLAPSKHQRLKPYPKPHQQCEDADHIHLGPCLKTRSRIHLHQHFDKMSRTVIPIFTSFNSCWSKRLVCNNEQQHHGEDNRSNTNQKSKTIRFLR